MHFNANDFHAEKHEHLDIYAIGLESIDRFILSMFFLFSFCRGKPVHLTTNEDDAAASATDEEPSVIVQLSNRVQDGTRCRIGSLDMCIQGRCQVISTENSFYQEFYPLPVHISEMICLSSILLFLKIKLWQRPILMHSYNTNDQSLLVPLFTIP